MGSSADSVGRAGRGTRCRPGRGRVTLASIAAVVCALAVGVLPATAAPPGSGVAPVPGSTGGPGLIGADPVPAALAGALRRAKLSAPDATQYGRLGSGVAISGDTAVVGASGASAAYVFLRSGTAWTLQAELTASGSTETRSSANLWPSAETPS